MKRDSLLGVLIPALVRLQVADGANSSLQKAIGSAVGEIELWAHQHGVAPLPELPDGAVTMEPNWRELALRELEQLNAEGDNAVCSITEAHWKVHGIMKVWHDSHPSRIFFRGQHWAEWELIASGVRNGLSPVDSHLKVSDLEIAAVRRFQAKVMLDRGLFAAVFPDGRQLDLESAEWWALMQHYESGTRLVDITSSLLCALYFACADWDGSIGTNHDGAIYLFPQDNWRLAALNPDMVNGKNVGLTDQLQPTLSDYFSVHNYITTVRWRESFYRNDRLLAQDGYFLWQPSFDEPLAVGQHFKFRVPASLKTPLLKELWSVGYTPRRILRPPAGDEAEEKVREAIGAG